MVKWEDFPLYQHWMAESARSNKHEDIVSFLETRFGPLSEELTASIRVVTDLNKLKQGVKDAAACRSLKDFQKRFTAE